jgi:hypothetical protein
LNLLPVKGWGLVFISVGMMAILSSRWPAFAETWGYMLLTGLSAGWSATYWLSLLLHNAPVTNITAGLVWALMAFMWWAVSGLVNPVRVVRDEPD